MIDCDPRLLSACEQLLVILDEQIALLHDRRGQLEQLTEAALARDEQAMESLVTEIERSGQQQSLTDVKLRAIRANIARTLKVKAADLRLAVVATMLPPADGAALDLRRNQVMQLCGQLRRQHLTTSVVLQECSRVNRLLLMALTGQEEGPATYGQGGQPSWGLPRGIVNAER